MRLLILSNMAHYRRDGEIVGHGATAREIDHLATLFEEVVHVGCLHEEEAPASALPYTAPNVQLRGVPPAGGASFRDKAAILTLFPRYARAIREELRWADAVHVRCPANLSLLAVLMLILWRHPKKRWIKYAGNWGGYEGEALSYRLQRWLLNRGLVHGEVTVNGRWPGQPAHVRSFLNPCLTREELDEGRAAAATKRLALPLRLLFIGHLSAAKGMWQAIEVLVTLRELGVPAHLTFVGDGPEREALARRAWEEGLASGTAFEGWVPRTRLGPYLEAAHFILLPSQSEGWPKVLSEGMAYGAVPVAGAVGSIPDVLGELSLGVVVDPRSSDLMAREIARYAEEPERWKAESERAVAAAPRFSYETYQEAVRDLFKMPAGVVRGSLPVMLEAP